MAYRGTAWVAAVVLVTTAASGIPFAAAAQEAVSCLAKPGGPLRGGHWYYRLDRTNGQKCWFYASKMTTASPVAAESWFDFGSSSDIEARDVGCSAVATGPAPRSKAWYYRRDQATGQKCWYLARAQIGKTKRFNPTRSAISVPAAASDTPTSLHSSPEVAPHKATRSGGFNSIVEPAAWAKSPSSAMQFSGEDPSEFGTSSFAARWINLSTSASRSDRQSQRTGSPFQPAAVVGHLNNSTEAPPGLPGWAIDIAWILLVVSLGATLVLFRWRGVGVTSRRVHRSGAFQT